MTNDPFHPGQLVNLLIEAEEITSAQLMGYGSLDEVQTPIVRLFYKNGTVEDVFDVWHNWS